MPSIAASQPAHATGVARVSTPEPAHEGAGPGAAHVSPEHLQLVAAEGWLPLDQEWLGSWWLRAADGFTGRANSVVPVGDPGLPLDDALAHVQSWYAGRGLPPQVQLVNGSHLDVTLGGRGWELRPGEGGGVAVQVAAVDDVLAALERWPLPADVPRVRVLDRPDDDWLWLYRGEGPLPPAARTVLTSAPVAGFAAAGAPRQLAIGRVCVTRGWAGVSAIEVRPAARRRGLARAVMRALLRWARDRGAEQSYLQVSGDNAAAHSLYAALGYRTHHRYRYRRAPGAAS